MPHLMNCAHDPEGWCLDCVKELAESTLPAAAVRDALELYDSALSEAEAILGGEYGDYHAHLMEAVDKARTMRAALGLGAEGEKR